MRYATLARFLFILYCVEAGLFLILAPWSANWDRACIQLPIVWLRTVALHPALRGAVTGFGSIHLVWGTHDLEHWLSRLRSPGAAPSA
jgi:hypothetical protein